MIEVNLLALPEMRPVEGFPGYAVSADGRVWSRRRRGVIRDQPRQLKPTPVGGVFVVGLATADGGMSQKRTHALRNAAWPELAPKAPPRPDGRPQVGTVPASAKPIPGFDGYFADADGGIYNSRGLRIQPHREPHGYERVHLVRSDGEGGDGIRVHRVVLLAWAGPPDPGHEARHLNGVRHDNRAENLAWGTRSQNRDDSRRLGTLATGDRHGMRKHPERVARGERQGSAKLTEAQVREMRELHAAGWKYKALAEKYGIVWSAAQNICHRRRWKHVQ